MHTPHAYAFTLLQRIIGWVSHQTRKVVAVAPVVVVGVNRGQNGHRSSTNWLLWLEQQPRALTTALTRYPGRMKEELARYMRRERCTRRHIRRTGAKGGQLRLWGRCSVRCGHSACPSNSRQKAEKKKDEERTRRSIKEVLDNREASVFKHHEQTQGPEKCLKFLAACLNKISYFRLNAL